MCFVIIMYAALTFDIILFTGASTHRVCGGVGGCTASLGLSPDGVGEGGGGRGPPPSTLPRLLRRVAWSAVWHGPSTNAWGGRG
jgi:hypothetical protein